MLMKNAIKVNDHMRPEHRTLVAVVVVLSALLLSVAERVKLKVDSGSDSEGDIDGSHGGDHVTRRDVSRYRQGR